MVVVNGVGCAGPARPAGRQAPGHPDILAIFFLRKEVWWTGLTLAADADR